MATVFKRRRGRRRGFSLVEILVTAIVMSIALIVLATCFTIAVKTQRKVRSMTIAQHAVQSKLAHLRAMGWAYLPWGKTVEGVSSLTYGTMTTDVTFAIPGPEAPDSLALIQVQLYWGGSRNGKPARGEPVDSYRLGHVRYVTYMTEP